jgi:hypothetical protein
MIPSSEDPLYSTVYDVIVCGAGPAGVSAAIAAGRAGAKVLLVEPHNCLGGVWTSGLLSYILDGRGKSGLMAEIRERLAAYGGVSAERDLYDAEIMKLVLDELCEEAGVEVLLYAKLADATVSGRVITHAILECKEGRRTVAGRCFVDTTGDGDLAARAGCGYDLGREEDGATQPFSLMSIISGLPEAVTRAPFANKDSASCLNKAKFLELLRETGYEPTYVRPSIFPLPNGFATIMVDQQYGFSGLVSEDLSRATQLARKDVAQTVEAMKRVPGWENVKLISTAAHIGVREGRRIHGLYRVTVEDVVTGRRHADAVAECTASIDIHAPRRHENNGGYNSDLGHHALPFDIPLRALIARDRDNLVMAGRCISGDFLAHASYRVTGNAVATGQAAGTAAAMAALQGVSPAELDPKEVLQRLPHAHLPPARSLATVS